MNRRCIFAFVTVYIFSLPALAMQWPTSISFDSDAGSGAGSAISNNNGDSVLRCDASQTVWPTDENENVITPSQCHRYGLIWSPDSIADIPKIAVGDNHAEYDPSRVGSEWRLPTIKELVRIFSYGTETVAGETKNLGIQDSVLSAWLAEVDDDGYLLSSTYRNISGVKDDNDYEYNQLYVVKISSGQVLAAEPGWKSGPTTGLRLCFGMKKSGQKLKGACEYNNVTEASKVNFYALKVRTQTTSELGFQ